MLADYFNFEKPLIRKRNLEPKGGISSYSEVNRHAQTGAFLSKTGDSVSMKFSGWQETVSEEHAWFSSKDERGKTDLGGPFSTVKYDVIVPPPFSRRGTFISSPNVAQTFQFEGYCYAVNPATTVISHPPQVPLSELVKLGATAIARVAPLNPVAELTTALGELRLEGIPLVPGSSLWEERTGIARKAGGEYLNAVFGWLPLIADIVAIGGGIKDSDRIIDQIKKDVGKNIRRRYNFPTLRSRTFSSASNRLPECIRANSFYSPGTRTAVLTTTTDRWFSGCFTYYFPDNIAGRQRIADLAILAQQLGLEVTPEVVWNLTPWSWAFDWVSNAGDCISNWTRFHKDGLVMKYGYMMEKTIYDTTYTLDGCTPANPVLPSPAPVSFRTEYKSRIAANPYGFGLTYDGLSGFQQSILAALGLTRVRR